MKVESRFVRVSGLRFHVVEVGPDTGEPVVLLHGFPDAWFSWQAQFDALRVAGFRAIAPDQRGYNLSDKPKGIQNYTVDKLAADVLRLADALRLNHFSLVGHDFGAMVCWKLALEHPERVKRMVISNVPHPMVMHNFLRSSLRQMQKSSYIGFFQLPLLPEKVLRLGNWQLLRQQLSSGLTKAQVQQYLQAWEQPGAINSMLNWYRAFRYNPGSPENNLVHVPTRIIWGKKDPYLLHEMAEASMKYVMLGDLRMLTEAGHWVQHDAPDKYNSLLLEHLIKP
ncbi:alpha/beta fold hydrolase [Pontibacter akesuensis]|uniref:Pimeloyl-ACP methyl ester carboxylesterase n=1 Tax=Pontibacter akesuensis TaxID=388950 RepID=A0A1I7FT74_9BACT|nr:alpha/beta hydrolase [Pontibacter akesuensis]GHA60635.1 alpha/beta hydrolase [Pontibacter akesuensis]SFU39358.1 Pimeloyl-ACP methyl ester carboxylesterase [Pontibacter akesuensis]